MPYLPNFAPPEPARLQSSQRVTAVGLAEGLPHDHPTQPNVEPNSEAREAVADAFPAAWPPRPADLGRWPIAWRQRWADRTARLEDEGLDWRHAESMAYGEMREAGAGPEGGAAPDSPIDRLSRSSGPSKTSGGIADDP
jgi:hypothetical protein